MNRWHGAGLVIAVLSLASATAGASVAGWLYLGVCAFVFAVIGIVVD